MSRPVLRCYEAAGAAEAPCEFKGQWRPCSGPTLSPGPGQDVATSVDSPKSHSPRRTPSISTAATIAALVSIVASLWIGVALFMAVLYGKTLPADSRQTKRVVLGALTFFIWYTGMLSAMSIVAMLTVRTVREVRGKVLALLALTVLLWCIRRLVHRAFVPGTPSG